jgi:hypothetical protein
MATMDKGGTQVGHGWWITAHTHQNNNIPQCFSICLVQIKKALLD